jgi:cytochrome c oxidase assembly protein subunit 15
MMQAPHHRTRPVAIWLLVGVFMIIIQIILGGVTRLTDSGLSITEWKPLLGTIPPLNEAEWNAAFDSYKEIAQYKHLHSHFTLSDFKSIFFWEWMHRLWGRLIGIVFLIPFIVFLVQGRFSRAMVRPMIILFLLGGLQGAIGWIMVKSGLNNEDLYVSHIRLSIHFLAALGLLVYTGWFALKLLYPQQQGSVRGGGKRLLKVILAGLVVQLAYGAFMAGLKAAASAPTWPDINGSYLPPSFSTHAGRVYDGLSALVSNPLVVHFIHRNLAYLLTVLILIWTFRAVRQQGSRFFNRVKWLPLLLVAIQVALGVAAVLTAPGKVPQRWGVFEWNAQLHQFVAMLLLLALTTALYAVKGKETQNQ